MPLRLLTCLKRSGLGGLTLIALSACPPDADEDVDDASCLLVEDAATGVDNEGDPATESDDPAADAGAESTVDACQPFVFTPGEMDLVHSLSPLPELPPDTTNAFADNAAAAALGQRLFFETAYSGPLAVASDLGQGGDKGKISCFSCHSGPAFDDRRSNPMNVSLGANFHTRNAPALVNSSFYRWTNWGGRFSAQWELPMPVAENPVIMNSSRLRIAHVIFEKYRAAYDAVFEPDLDPDLGNSASQRFPLEGKPKPVTDPPAADGAWEKMSAEDRTIVNRIFVNFGKALAAYTRRLVSRGAPFDQFVAGDAEAIDCAAKRGLQLFVGKARCVTCHLGPYFSDDQFHNLGVPQIGPHVPASDTGRFKDIPPLLDSPLNSASVLFSDDVSSGRLAGLAKPPPALTLGQFRTPGLRNVAKTGPYMHTGQFATLSEVVEFYNQGGATPAMGMGTRDPLIVPLHLSTEERADLVAFLESLSGAPIPDSLLSH